MAQSPLPPQSAPPKSAVQTYASKAVPWRGDVLWWVVLAEGVVAFLVGLYIVLAPTQAQGIFLQLVGGFVLFDSVMAIVRLARGRAEAAGPGRWIRVGVGLVVGIVALFYPSMAMMTVGSAATVLAIGLIVIGGLGIYAIFATHSVAGWRWGQMIIYILYVVLAILIFYRNMLGTDLGILPIIGWIILLGGLALIGYGVWLYQKYASAKAAEDAAAVLASSPTTLGTPATPAPASAPATAPSPTTPAASSSGGAASATSTTATPKAASPGQNSTAANDGNGSTPTS